MILKKTTKEQSCHNDLSAPLPFVASLINRLGHFLIQPFFQRDSFWKQDIVFEMDMKVQIFFKISKHSEGNIVSCASICRRRIVVRKFSNFYKSLSFNSVLIHHHCHRIFYRTKMWGNQILPASLCLNHLLNKWE